MLNRYPVLKPGTVLHTFPAGVEILREGKLRLRGNPDLGRFIDLCTGDCTLETLLRALTTSEAYFQKAAHHIEAFVHELEKEGILTLARTPGSREGYQKVMKGQALPSAVSIELTNQCNLKCIYCYQDSHPGCHRHLTDPVGVLAKLHAVGVRTVELTGGEPTLHPLFKEVLTYACAHFQIVGLITNGTTMSEEILGILQAGPAHPVVQVCLDGWNREDVDRVAGMPGSWGRILKGISRIIAHGIPFRVGIVLQDAADHAHVRKIVKLALDLGAVNVLATPVMSFGRGRDIPPFDFHAFLEVHRKLQEEFGDRYAPETGGTLTEFHAGCGAGHRSLAVNWDGELRLCVIQPQGTMDFGHVSGIDTEDYQRRIRGFQQLPHPSRAVCGNCPEVPVCNGCIVRAFVRIADGGVGVPCVWYDQHASAIDALLKRPAPVG